MASPGFKTDFGPNPITTSLLLSHLQALCDTAEKLKRYAQGNIPTMPALFVSPSNTTEHSAPVSENAAESIFGIRGVAVEEIGAVTLIIADIARLPYSTADNPRTETLKEYNPGVNLYADN
jgi:hypothetical protein